MSNQSKLESRRQADFAAIKALCEFLGSIISRPNEYSSDRDLMSALASQGAMAAWSHPASGVQCMSLNHQKKVANACLGDWRELDRLRVRARDALLEIRARKQPRAARSRESLIAKAQELEKAVRALKEDLFILQRAYDLRCIHARHYAEVGGPSTVALCNREQREVDASFSLRRMPIADAKVVNFPSGNRHG